MPNVKNFHALLKKHGSDAVYHRVVGGAACPCRTPEGYRDPIWHLQHPTDPDCNEAGFLPGTIINMAVKGFVQPIQSTRATRLSTEYLIQMFGEIQGDDHLGIFPVAWGASQLDFNHWSSSGEEYIGFQDRRYTVVNANKMADSDGGEVNHHWETGLRLIEIA